MPPIIFYKDKAIRGVGIPQGILVPRDPASLSVVASDAFAAADGTALMTYNANLTKITAASNNTASPSIDGGRVHNENANTNSAYYRADYTPGSADYTVECDVVMRSDNNLSNAGPAGRMSTSANTLYHAQYNTSGNVWQLVKRVAGVASVLASAAATLVVDQAYRVALRMVGSTISMTVDGALIGSATDTAIPDAGRAGFRLAGNATATVGVHLDNWEVWA